MKNLQRVLRWVIGVRRPLKLGELEEAIVPDSKDTTLLVSRIARGAGRRIVNNYGNLVIYDEDDATVSLAHHTVQQYLCADPKSLQVEYLETDFDPVSVDEYIANICLAYLCFIEFETQVANVTKMVLPRRTADQLIWWGMPIGSQM